MTRRSLGLFMKVKKIKKQMQSLFHSLIWLS